MKIEIWSDVICPFCYIGKRKLEAAIAQTGIDAHIEWHSFELRPDAPASWGLSLPEAFTKMLNGDQAKAEAIISYEEKAGKAVGLDFDLRAAKPGNTFNAHRLLHLAKGLGLGDTLKEAFFEAYFNKGLEIGDAQVLRSIAIDVGVSPSEVDDVLSSDRFADDVRRDEAMARNLGIRGVPYFMIDGKIAVSGAQDVAHFVNILREHSTKPAPAGSVCEDGVCSAA